MKKIVLGLLMLGIAIGLCSVLKADVPLDSKRFSENSYTELEAKDYRIEIIAYDIATETPYLLYKDTFPYSTEGSTVTFYNIIHGNVK